MITQKRLSFDFVAPTKRCKSEHHAPIDMARNKLCKEKLAALQQLCVEHEKHLAEEYFLSQKNHVLDFDIWRKNLPTAYQTHLKDNEFEIGDLEEEFAIFDEPATPSTVVRQQSTSDALELSPIVPAVVQEAEMTTVSSMIDFSNFASTSVPNTPIVIKAEIPNDQQRVSSINMQQSYVSSTLHNGEMSPNIAQTPESITTPSTSVQIDTRIVPTDDYSSSVESSDHKPRLAIDNKFSRQQDANVERVAKQEANILRRIAELRREGLWSTAKMPKCMDPPRSKTHWDYVLEEMQWMAVDFEQERKWKRNASKKLVIAVARQKRELDDRERKIEIDKEKELKRVASFMAREIRQFWNSVEKVVEYKTENIIEAKKKRALDKHLDFIVNQTEKYSSLISEGLNKTVMTGHGDSEYEDENSSEDDESTIARAEIDIDQKQVSEEIALLQKESEMD
uniref:HSA domain-containing protein n=1 Tax=Romanomermis culicivorax TaxID=13658 RepID=A0A915JA00_ROMCU